MQFDLSVQICMWVHFCLSAQRCIWMQLGTWLRDVCGFSSVSNSAMYVGPVGFLN